MNYRYGLEPDYLECKSTNCGNNITYLLDLLEEKEIPCKSIILSQDATMQRRMEAGLKKYMNDDENGYGPKGKGFIAHVEIPVEVKNAFDELKEVYSALVREANPMYASK